MEKNLQRKIREDLEARGYIAVVTVDLGTNGHADIFACSPRGVFLAIEAKDDGKKPVPGGLQEYRIEQVLEREGVSFWCNTFASYILQLKHYEAKLLRLH